MAKKSNLKKYIIISVLTSIIGIFVLLFQGVTLGDHLDVIFQNSLLVFVVMFASLFIVDKLIPKEDNPILKGGVVVVIYSVLSILLGLLLFGTEFSIESLFTIYYLLNLIPIVSALLIGEMLKE